VIGKTISHYKILEKLGEGGMGEVFLAEDTELDRKIALKFLPPHYTQDKEIKARFKREAKAAAALNHPNIITVYEVGEHQGQTFIAMEYVKGESLRDRMKQQLSPKESIELIAQVCDGLGKAHKADIVHRDIKPENIMIDEDGRVRILDFGLAKLRNVSKLTQTATTLGTLNYMSPEQLQGLEVDAGTDIWSVGVTLYEMITGRTPFEGDYDAAVSYAIMHEEPEPLARYKAGISDGLQRIIDKALDKEKETRYQSISDLLADLKREKRDSSAAIKPVGKLRKAILGQRSFTLASLLLIAFIAIFAIDRLQMQSGSSFSVTHKQITFVGNIPMSTELDDLSAISPDGQFLAYPLPKDSTHSVMVQDLSGGQPVEVYRGFESLLSLRWSPDGSRLLLFGAEKGALRQLIIPRFGGKPQTLPRIGYACWSPDGAQLAGTLQSRQSITFYNATTGDSTNIIRLHGFSWFLDIDWAPVGDRIAFATSDEQNTLYTIWTVQTDGTRQLKIVEEAGLLYSPRWSNYGNSIYYLRDNGQTRDLMKIALSVKDGMPRGDAKVLQSGLNAVGFTLSGDNRKLGYTKYLPYTNLWLVTRAEEGVETKKLTRGTHSFRACRIAPDGKKIAFGRRQNIFVMPIAGGEMQQLTFFKSDTYIEPGQDICWSPDGKELAFSLENKVWLVPANGGPSRAFDNTDSWGDLAWTPYTEILYQRLGIQNAHFLNPLNGEERPLLSNDSLGWIFSPTYSPDCRNVAICWNRKDGDGTGLWIISLKDSSQTLLSKGWFYPIEWSEDGEWIYAVNRVEEPTNVYMIPLSGGQPKILLTLPFEKTRYGGYGAVSMTSDGKRIVCNVEETQSDVWLLENFDPEVK